MTETRSTCPYCGVGCGVIIESSGSQRTGERIVGVRGDPDHPANFGRLCTKGATLHLTASADITAQARLLHPMQRQQRGAPAQRTDWHSALDLAAHTFADIIQTHGPDAVGFYISGQLLTEDYYIFNKLAKGLIGTNNIDSNSRLCMSSAVAGYKQTLGMDAPPACYDDIHLAGTLFITGSNTAYAHPILFRRIEDARRANPAMKIVVVDTRRTDTADIADLFLQIQPGTDVMLHHGMLHLMLWEGWLDAAFMAAHTSGFDALKTLVRDCTPDTVARVCGISKEALFQATQWFAGVAPHAGSGATASADTATQCGSQSRGRSPTLSLYCQGLNQSGNGTAKNTSLINLHLATGQIGKPGAGPFSLTGQPNAMGGREVGGMANLLSGHRDLGNPAHRAEVAALWGVPDVPSRPGKTAVEMFQAAADGEIKALWIACTNPAQSMPDQATVRRALQRAEFVVVQEAFAATATCAYADLLLPASTWGEKEGTVTNSERRISRVRAAVIPAGDARHDWQIATDFAQRLEALLPARTPTAPTTLFPYPSPESIWNEHRESTRGRDLDITGLSYAMLEVAPQQWPMPQGQATGQARLYENGAFPTPDGKAHFVSRAYQPVAEPRTARYPFSLTTGRLRDQWHGMSRTGTLGRLFGHASEPCVQLHPQDMQQRQLKDGDLVHLTSPRGSVMVPAQASPEVGLNQAFMAMHWGEEFISGQSAQGERLAGVNALTSGVFCPDSKQPEFKHTAVKILKADMPWNLLAVAWLPQSQLITARSALQGLMAQFDFATCVPFSNGVSAPVSMADAASAAAKDSGERCGLLFRAARHEAPETDVLAKIESLMQLQGPDVLRYTDPKRGQRRAARLVETETQTVLEGVLLAGDVSAQGWITTLLKESLPAHSYGRALLIPGATPPVPVVSRGQQVCACFNVTDVAIQSHLNVCTGAPSGWLASLQNALKCGTNCGSCLPQLQRMVGQIMATPAVSA